MEQSGITRIASWEKARITNPRQRGSCFANPSFSEGWLPARSFWTLSL